MRRWIPVLAAAAVALFAGWMLLSPTDVDPRATRAVASEVEPRASAPDRPASPAATQTGGTKAVAAKRKVSAQERAAVRERIVEALARRKAAAPPEESPATRHGDEDAANGPGDEIKDRTGGELGSFVVAVNQDFLPLANECYQEALEGDPALRGMLDLNVEVIADEEIGGLVESVDLGAENEITHAGMTECIRESMLSTVFPPPDGSGSQGVRLTLRFEPEP